MGGFIRAGFSTAATERYDIVRDRWTRVANMPVALNHAAAVAYRGRVYVLGGYSSRTGLDDEVATLYRYDPRRDRWRRLPSMPTAHGALAVGVIGGRLYAAGGAGQGGVHAELEIYDFKQRRWSRGPAMAVARDHLAGAVAGGRFYALAGRARGHGNYDVVEAYNPRTRRWRTLPRMQKPRGGSALRRYAAVSSSPVARSPPARSARSSSMSRAGAAGRGCAISRRRATDSASSPAVAVSM
jgi:hypothetical protein